MRYRLEQERRPRREELERGRHSRRDEDDVQFELRASSLLLLLGALAIICGVAYAIGYTIGRHSAPQTFSLNAAPPAPTRQHPITNLENAGGAQPPNPAQLSAAEQGKIPATLAPPANGAPAAATQPPGNARQSTAAARSAATGAAGGNASAPGTGKGTAANGYAVQVFAGVMRSDALSLAAALKARQYPVFVLPPTTGQTLYRVQIGPYATAQQAAAMRARLMADGYNAVIKARG